MNCKYFKNIFTILLIVAVMAVTGGCRFSDVIEEIVLSQVMAEEINDYSIYDDSEDADDMSEDLPGLAEYEFADKENSQSEELGAFDEDSNDSSNSGGLVSYSEVGSTTDTPASTGNDNPDETNEFEVSYVEYGEEDNNSNASGENDINENNGTGTSENGGDNVNEDEKGENREEGGSGTGNTIYGENGSQQTVPSNIYGVAAVGNTAIAVMMLGGTDVLKATNANLIANSEFAWNIYSEKIDQDIDIAWSGNGDNGITDLDVILNNDDINLVIVTSGENTITESQAQQIKAVKGEDSILTLPRITSLSTAKTVANMIGSALGNGVSNGTGVNAISRAAAYCSWIDKYASKMDETYYTLYVDGWDSTATYNLGTGTSGESLSGTGAAVIQFYKDSSQSVISGILNDINVKNCTSLSNSNRSTGLYLYAPWYPAGCADLKSNNYPTSSVNDLFDIPYSVGSASEEDYGYEIDYTGSNILGNSNFPFIIAGDNSTRVEMENNFLWTAKQYISHGLAGYGVLADGNLYLSLVCDHPRYVTNPFGVTSWTESTLESVLETVWYKAMAEGNESACYSAIKEFYSQFYNYTLSETELQTLIAGK